MSIASRANQKINTQVKRGVALPDAVANALKTYPADTTEHKAMLYARFSDRSYMRVVYEGNSLFKNGYSQVLDHHTSKFAADKIIDNIHAYCDKCGKEVWCNTDGRPSEEERFEFPGIIIPVCKNCQREIVKRSLLGEYA